MPYRRASAWSMRWSSGFLKSSWITLWSTYWTARSTFTRGTSSCSNCIIDIVPVASCSSVWSTRSEIGAPGVSSPSTRCSRRIWRVRFSAIRETYPPRRTGEPEGHGCQRTLGVWPLLLGLSPTKADHTPPVLGPLLPSGAHERPPRRGHRAVLARRPGGHVDPAALDRLHVGLDLHEAADPGGGLQVHLEPAGEGERPLVVEEQRHRLVERAGDHAAVGVAGRPLVVLLDEETAGHPAPGPPLELELEAEQVGLAAAEAEVVVGEALSPAHGAGPARGGGCRPRGSRATRWACRCVRARRTRPRRRARAACAPPPRAPPGRSSRAPSGRATRPTRRQGTGAAARPSPRGSSGGCARTTGRSRSARRGGAAPWPPSRARSPRRTPCPPGRTAACRRTPWRRRISSFARRP